MRRMVAMAAQRMDTIAQVVLIVCAIITTGLVAYVVHDVYREPAIRFDRMTVLPEHAAYCAGETVRYAFNFTVTHGPVLVGHRVVLWDVDEPQTRRFATIVEWGVYEQGDRVVETRSYDLPDDVPAGPAELRIASSETAKGTAYMHVPFTIIPCSSKEHP